MRYRTKLLVLVLLVTVVAPACDGDDEFLPDGSTGAQEGQACSQKSDCNSVLECAGDGTCQRPGEPGTAGVNEGCSVNEDCVIDLVCNSTSSKCATPGTGSKGVACKGNQDCEKGLLCSAAGKCAEPGEPGTKKEGDACVGETDCALGLRCLDEKCVRLSFWNGANCQPDSGPLRSYFEVPRGNNKLLDFYRLPFPNDIRLKNGTVDVTNHPDPGVVLPPPYNNVVKAFYDQIKTDVRGFGVNTGIYFRFSDAIDLSTLTLQGGTPTVVLYNVTPSSPGYGRGASILLGAQQGRSLYICDNWMVIRPAVGQPLRANTTYAVLLKKGITKQDDKGVMVDADADFKVMRADSPPGDASLRAAWDKYKPLRDFIADASLSHGINTEDVINAAVFTTMDPRARMRKMRAAVHKETAPVLKELTLCDGVAKSPCDDGKDKVRVCPSTTSGKFHELHGRYDTPVYQQGTPPYATDGGNISYNAQGEPIRQRDEKACVAMSVPKDTMPANGWPVVIFAHGTGGSLRTFINNGTAERLAAIRDDAGTDISKMLVISIDGSMHGPRSGKNDDPDYDPGLAFFNLLNPKAARDNVYQAAIDKLNLVRLVKKLDLTAAASPTGQAIKIDASKIYFFGHSQGAIEGPPMLAFEPDVAGMVLSGAGGYLISSMLEKKKPFDIATQVQVALADPNVNRGHPLLNLLQLFFEEVDTVNYGRALFAELEKDVPQKHTFLSYGSNDSYTPPGAIDALAISMGVQQVTRCGDGVCTGQEDCKSCGDDCPSAKCEDRDSTFSQLDAPVKGNMRNGSLTAAMVRYKGKWTSADDDDHFVLFRLAEGQRQSTWFLGTAARDGVPTIPKDK
jgi:predicted esterase